MGHTASFILQKHTKTHYLPCLHLHVLHIFPVLMSFFTVHLQHLRRFCLAFPAISLVHLPLYLLFLMQR